MVHLSRTDLYDGVCGIPLPAEERLCLGHVARVLARVSNILPELAVLWPWVPLVVRT